MADKEGEQESASNPGTEPFVPDFSDSEDTGSQPPPAAPEKSTEAAPEPTATAEQDSEQELGAESVGVPVQPVTVPGRYQYLKWWKLVLVILGVWVATAEIGLSLFYWWYHTVDKTAAVYTVLVYVVACAVGGVMLAMVEGRPMISALSIAVMAGPLGSVAAAAPLYGYYYCERVGHCLVGVVPY